MTFTIDPGAVQSAIAAISATDARGAAFADSGSPIPETAPMPAMDSPWPDIALTKKGEAYCAEHEGLTDIDLRDLFGEPDAWRSEVEVPRLAEADGVFFLTLSNDRASVAYTIERLIDMLDAMEADPDLEDSADSWIDEDLEYSGDEHEPTLGAPEKHPTPYGGSRPAYGQMTRPVDGDQTHWADGEPDEREAVCEDEGAQCDDEGALDSDREPELGTTEEIDQERRLETTASWGADGGEPELGWSGHGRGWREGDATDDREGDDEREEGHEDADVADDEPWLSWTDAVNQASSDRYGRDDGSDREEVNEDSIEWRDTPASAWPERNVAVDPAVFPDRYTMTCEGHCMSPGLPDGSRIEVDKTEPAAPGDLVVVFLDPKVVQRGHHTCRIKRLVASDPQGMLIVEMDNPPAQVFWPRSWVRAVHKVIRVVDDREPRGPRITQADLLARYAADLAARRGETRPC